MTRLISQIPAIAALKIRDRPTRGTRNITKVACWGDECVALNNAGELVPMSRRIGRHRIRIDGNLNRGYGRRWSGWIGDFLRCAVLLEVIDSKTFEEWETIHKARDDRNRRRADAKYLAERISEEGFKVPAAIQRLADEPEEKAEEPSDG